MKVILTTKEPIVSKSGDEYVKVGFIDCKSGKVGEIFTTKKVYDSFEISDDKFLQSSVLKELVATSSIAEVEFDQRGRLVSLE